MSNLRLLLLKTTEVFVLKFENHLSGLIFDRFQNHRDEQAQ
jgi:hypothetical protein